MCRESAMAGTMLVVAWVLASGAWSSTARAEGAVATATAAIVDVIPADGAGFAGLLNGEIVAKLKNDQLLVKVAKIEQVWKQSRAKDPASLVGKNLLVGLAPDQAAKRGEAGSRLRQFVAALKPGAKESLDVAHRQGNELVLVELTKDQRDRTPAGDEGAYPAAARGFAGMVKGKIAAKGEDQVTMEVTSIARTWKHSKAEKADALVGKKIAIVIRPETYKNKKGSPNYVEAVRRFFRQLQVGDVEALDVRHDGGDTLTFLELDEAQGKRAGLGR